MVLLTKVDKVSATHFHTLTPMAANYHTEGGGD